MPEHSPGNGRNPIVTGIWYSLPRLIAKPISAIFTIYFPDLFIHTFEWKPGDFGLVTSIHSLARAISYFSLGFVFKFAVDEALKSSDPNDKQKLKYTNIITVASILLYTVTFIFLIVLPIYWTGGNVHTLYTLSRLKTLGNLTHLETHLAKIFPEIGVVRPAPKPPPLPPYIGCFNNRVCGSISRFFASSWRFARSRLFVAIFVGVLHAIGLSSYELCNRALPTYIDKDDSNLKTMTGVNMAAYTGTFLFSVFAIASVKHFLGHTITDAEFFLILGFFFFIGQFPILAIFFNQINDEESSAATSSKQEAPAQCKCCCSTQEGSQCEKCDCSSSDETACQCKCCNGETGQSCCCSCRPCSSGTGACTCPPGGKSSENCPCCASPPDGTCKCCCCCKPVAQCPDGCTCPQPEASTQTSSSCTKAADWCQLISMIVLHGSINFWMTAAAPAVEYVCTHIIIGNEPLRNFGPLVLLLCATVASVIYTVLNEKFGDKGNKSASSSPPAQPACTAQCKCCCCCKKCENCKCQTEPKDACKCCCCKSAGSGTTCNCCPPQQSASENSKAKKSNWPDIALTAFTILGQSFIYILMYEYNYWWNKGNWLHFVLIGLSGVACGLYLLNINNLQNSVVKKECFKQWKWVIIGILFSFMYLTTACGLYLMYKVYDVPKIVNHRFACIRWTYSYDFTNVFRIITIFYQILNAISATAYFVPEFLSSDSCN